MVRLPFLREIQKKRVKAFFLIGALVISGSLGAWAASPEQLKKLNQEKSTLDQKTNLMRQKKNEKLRAAQYLNQSIYQNQIKLEQTRRNLASQQSQLIMTQSRLVYLTEKLDQTLGEITRLTTDAASRLRSLYMGERVSLLQMILDANDVTVLMDRLYYKQRMVAQDKQLLVTLKRKTQEMKEQQEALAVQKQRLSDSITTISTYRGQVADRIAADRMMRDKYKHDAAYYARAEAQLLSESSKIRNEILSLTGRGGGGAKAPPVANSTGQFIMPIYGAITSQFGHRTHPIHKVRLMHTGLDIAGPNGGAVKAADGGKVIHAGWRGGYGKVVMINHGDRNGVNLVTLYAHLSAWTVKTGDYVKQGQVIGREGSTGFATGPHVHFEIRENGTPVNPNKYLK